MRLLGVVSGFLALSLLVTAGLASGRQDSFDLASDVCYLVVQTETGRALEQSWDNIEKPIPPGSLVKPFTAIAYAETHLYRYPAGRCRGAKDGCWLRLGHGQLNLRSAIAGSCNTYFRQMAQSLSLESVARVARRFGMAGPSAESSPESFVGLGWSWKIRPVNLARAYAELVRRSADPAVAPLVQGFALSARTGTGRAVGAALGGKPVLAKTGTGPCVHRGRSNGDGYAIALYPAEKPRLTLLVQMHGAPGRVAAGVCGRLLAEQVLQQ